MHKIEIISCPVSPFGASVSGSFPDPKRSKKGHCTERGKKTLIPFPLMQNFLVKGNFLFTKEIIRYSVRRPSERVFCYSPYFFLFIHSSNGVAYFRFFFLTFLLTPQPKIELLLHNFWRSWHCSFISFFYTYDLQWNINHSNLNTSMNLLELNNTLTL